MLALGLGFRQLFMLQWSFNLKKELRGWRFKELHLSYGRRDRSILDEFKVIHREKVYWIHAKETIGWVLDFVEESDDEDQDEINSNDDGSKDQGEKNLEEGEMVVDVEKSEDPFNIYTLLNKKVVKDGNDNKSDGSLNYPPWFSPMENNDENNLHGGGDSNYNGESLIKKPRGVDNETSRNNTLKLKYKVDGSDVVSSGYFKKSKIPRTGGSILGLLDEVVKVEQVMGYKREAKKDWVKELCNRNKVNFLALQETKMEVMDIFCVRACWGNLVFDYVHSAAVGNSGGILYVWDSNAFCKDSVTISDSFIIVRGKWRLTGQNCMLIAVYAPHDTRDKHLLWDNLQREIGRWKGEVVIMGDFNEVRFKSDRFGSTFNAHGANIFNSFIMNSGLVELNLGGSPFTWCHKSASKMSKLDRFLVSENLMNTCPNIHTITLERYLSDHRPILLREAYFDYGPTPFKLFHYWFELEGFGKVVEDAWRDYPGVESNEMRYFMGKLKYRKNKWNKMSRSETLKVKLQCKSDLEAIDDYIDNGNGAQKVKIKWAVEGDENYSFFHGIINKKRNCLNVRGVMVDGVCVDNPNRVKREFFTHFSTRFCAPEHKGASIQMDFSKKLSDEQIREIECDVTNDEIKRAVWDCRTDKASGPDGFTFGFFRRFWNLIQNDVYAAVRYFFTHTTISKGCNSSFIALIPKSPNANLVKDFRPISLIGSLYKIIAKILANRIVEVLGGIVNEVQSAFIVDRQILDAPIILNEVIQWCKTKNKQALFFKVDFEKAYDSVRWDFLDDVLRSTRFCAPGHKGASIQMDFPKKLSDEQIREIECDVTNDDIKRAVWDCGTDKESGPDGFTFGFFRCFWNLIQNDVYAAVSIKLREDLVNPSHMFYVDDAVFVGQWCDSNITTLIHVRECFHKASGLRINMSKSKIMGVHVDDDRVYKAAGIDLMKYMRIKLGNGETTKFWEDKSCEEGALKDRYPSVYALENCKQITVGEKLSQPNLSFSFRRKPRGDFSVASVRNLIDSKMLPNLEYKTRWINYVPIKVNVHAWKITTDSLPTRFNISRRGICIDSILCANCDTGVETVRHLFFSCGMARDVVNLITRWWNLPAAEFMSYDEWLAWLVNVRLPSKNKKMLEGVFYVMWWLLWWFRNKSIFEGKAPKKAMFFDDLVSKSFN
nr:RNA-directed DNA polymerase, eukaryota [Tanacetum cinerariifolium]